MAGAHRDKILRALAYIIPNGTSREYFPGDSLPSDHPDADAWVKAGTAVWVDAEQTPPTYTMARAAAAVAGLPGTAVGGEATGNELVGKVPVTPQRRRRKRKS